MAAEPSPREGAKEEVGRLEKALILAWLGFALFGIFFRGEKVLPTDGFAIFSLLVSVALGLPYYRMIMKRAAIRSKRGFEKGVLVWAGPIIIPGMLWFSVLKPIPVLTEMFAVAPLDTVVTLGYKDVSLRGRPCRRSFDIREIGHLNPGKLCVEEAIWEQGRSGDRIRLMGRQHALAWYVDRIWLK